MKKNKKWIERGILAVIFVVAVVIFSFLTNRGDENTTVGIDSATYPKVSFETNGYFVNNLSGYAKEMNIPALRDTVTPVMNGKLTAVIDAHDSQLTAIDYCVYTLDGQEKLYENSISEPETTIELGFSGEGLLEEERVLQLTFRIGEAEKIYYYTRIVDATQANLKKCMDYAKNFHENALAKMEDAGIESAIETSAEGDNGTLQHVNIHNDFNHVTWGKLEPQVEQNIRWSIKELNNSYTCLQLEYQATCVGEENEQDEYKVEEFFKIRHSSRAKKTYLLEYDREMEQIFEPIRQVLGSKSVLLGIADENVSYATNKDENIVTFVQADELWSYDKEKNRMTQIFSFDAEEGYDERNLTRAHEIVILNHGNTGDVRFAVKGYMNRGSHEGEVGIAVYYYDAQEQATTEEAFITYENALQAKLHFNSKLNILYVLSDGIMHEFKFDYRSHNVIAEGLLEEEYKVSNEGKMIAFVQKNESGEAQKIILKNLKKEEDREIVCAEDECMKPLGFIGTDFIYGVSKLADAGSTISGEPVEPIYKLEIQNVKGESELSYEKEGKYILAADIKDNMITVSLGKKTKGLVYKETEKDYITNNVASEGSNIYLESYVTELKERQRRLTFTEDLSEKAPKIIKANYVMTEKVLSFELEHDQESEIYRVYAYGELFGVYHDLGSAVLDAKQHTGVVVDEHQKVIWEMSNRDLNYVISSENEVVSTILANLDAGMLPVEAAAEIEGVICVDLTGCEAEDLLYIINQDIPVIAMTSAKKAVVLYGYNEISVYYMEPGDDSRHSISYSKMDEMTKKSGNTYIGVK